MGLSLFIWVAGMLIAAAGTLVYLEFGTAIPRNGGEKNYLEFIFRRPKLLVTCIYALYAVLTVRVPASLNRTIANTITD